MKKSLVAVAAICLVTLARAGSGGFLHELPAGTAFRQSLRVEFPPAVTKTLLQDGAVLESWDALDARRPYCILEARSVTADQPTVLEPASEHVVEFVDHKWVDLPYGAGYATSFRFKAGVLAGLSCLKPSVYADDYLTMADFAAVAGEFLAPVKGR